MNATILLISEDWNVDSDSIMTMALISNINHSGTQNSRTRTSRHYVFCKIKRPYPKQKRETCRICISWFLAVSFRIFTSTDDQDILLFYLVIYFRPHNQASTFLFLKKVTVYNGSRAIITKIF